jgi:hypothetical protein
LLGGQQEGKVTLFEVVGVVWRTLNLEPTGPEFLQAATEFLCHISPGVTHVIEVKAEFRD